MANDKAMMAKRAKMLFWVWIGLWGFYIISFALAPLLAEVDWLSALVGILWIILPLVLLVFYIWSLVVIVRGSKLVGTSPALYIILSIIISIVGIPYSLWDLAKKLGGGKKKAEK